MINAPEQYRDKRFSDKSYGNNGVFVIPVKGNDNMRLACIISDGEGWEHVSVHTYHNVTGKERCPTWDEMCQVKDLFWSDEETVIQYHPPKSEYVNMHQYCLHLWKPIGIEILLPDSILVGF